MVIGYDKNSFDDLIKGEVLLLFYTKTCGKCRMMESSINRLSDFIPVVMVDADKERGVSKEYGVMSVPTLIYYKNGNYEKKNGYMSYDEIRNWLGDEIDDKKL